MRAVFLDISKVRVFDRVWLRGLIAKLRSIGVERNLLNWFISYLSCCKQRVIIEGVHSDWRNIESGVPQGLVLGPLLFLIYIIDLPTTITSNCFLFANDCYLLEKVQSPGDCASKLNHDLRLISDWAKRCLVTVNETKTIKAIVFSGKRDKSVHPHWSWTIKLLRMWQFMNILAWLCLLSCLGKCIFWKFIKKLPKIEPS